MPPTADPALQQLLDGLREVVGNEFASEKQTDNQLGQAILMLAVSTLIGAIAYAAKHITTSECWGAKCSRSPAPERAAEVAVSEV